MVGLRSTPLMLGNVSALFMNIVGAQRFFFCTQEQSKGEDHERSR